MQKNVQLFGSREKNDGLGRFATSIANELVTNGWAVSTALEESATPDLIVYASRSSRFLNDAFRLAVQYDVPLVALSSGIDFTNHPKINDVKLLLVSNSSKEVIDYMYDLQVFAMGHTNWEVKSLIECHQSSKSDVSGTALQIADIVNYDKQKIISVRNDREAIERYSIQPTDLDGYAIHSVTFVNNPQNLERTFDLRVIGRKTYVDGVVLLVRELLDNKLANKLEYGVNDYLGIIKSSASK